MSSPILNQPARLDGVSDIPLLVVSFDQYEDLWRPFFTYFWRNWPDCPFRVFLGTNFKSYDDARVTSIRTGTEVTWALRVRTLLDAVQSRHVLLILDDFLIYEKVHTPTVLRLAELAVERDVGCLRLAPKPPPSSAVEGIPELGWILATDPYRVASQISFWKTETLEILLNPGYNVWDFEFEGSLDSARISEPFWSVTRAAIEYQHCVEKGMWLPWGVRACREAGLEPDFGARPPMRGMALVRRYYSRARGIAFRLLPRRVQRNRWAGIVRKTRGGRWSARVAREPHAGAM